ncbi:MAG: hypothetical protein ACLPWF_06580 [Bryobacteraceae bacterium]
MLAGLDEGMLLFGMNCTENKNGRGEVGLYMTGLMLLTQVNVRWQQRRLRMNDEILVRIVETDKADKYKILQEAPHDPRKYERAYVRRMAKEFGWTIQAKKQSRKTAVTRRRRKA